MAYLATSGQTPFILYHSYSILKNMPILLPRFLIERFVQGVSFDLLFGGESEQPLKQATRLVIAAAYSSGLLSTPRGQARSGFLALSTCPNQVICRHSNPN